MLEAESFCNNFWGDKNQGFDLLFQNMKAGLKPTMEFLEFLREVFSLEDSCMKSWLKLSKQLNVQTCGALQPLWSSLKELLEKKSTAHMEVSQAVQIIIKSVQKYVEEQQNRHKTNKDIDMQTQHFSNMLLTTSGQLMRAKETYHIRYAEFHKINFTEVNNTSKSREVEKIETKLKKAVDEYKYLIEKYNNTCVKFKSKMNESCKIFEEIERNHLENMKDFIRKFSESMFNSQTELNLKQKEFLLYQEELTVEYMLKEFVKSKSIGKIPPEIVTFQEGDSYLNKKGSKVNSETSNDSGLNGNVSVDPLTGNLVNIDSWSDISSTKGSNLNIVMQPMKECVNDIFDRLSSTSDNNNINYNANIVTEPLSTIVNSKKTKKHNTIFRWKRNSPTNSRNIKSQSNLEKQKSSQSLGEFMVDEEGYSIRPPDKWNEDPPNSDSDSSSVDDPVENSFKGIKIQIKPQETKSNSSSIPDHELGSKELINEHLDLIKAVQAIKISQPISKDSLRRLTEQRSHTPLLIKESKERYPRQNFLDKDFIKLSFRESRRQKPISQSVERSKLPESSFKMDFESFFDDPFSKKFEAVTKTMDDNNSECDSDPWGCKLTSGVSPQPRLPNKITPPRASSALPYTHQKIIDPFNSSVISSHSPQKIPSPPMRTTLNSMEGIPLTISFTETFNAKFRDHCSNTPYEAHTNGLLAISFPCSMVKQFASLDETKLKSIEPIHFNLIRASRLRNVEPVPANKDIVLRIEAPTEDSISIFIDTLYLHKKLLSQHHKDMMPSFFNIEIIKYDVTNNVRSNGNINAPVYISSNWQFGDSLSSHLIISYSFKWPNTNVKSLNYRRPTDTPGDVETESHPRGEVRFLVFADGKPYKMQSLPPCVWNSELGRASWRLDLSSGGSNIKSKFFLAKGPGTSQPVICQFSAEGAIESGVLLQVVGNRFRISRHKYRLLSGKYLWEPLPNIGVDDGFCI